MSKRNTVTFLSAVCLLAVPPLLLLPATGWAQLEEVVVTTRRRTESLQDVPIAVRAITSEEIQRTGITDLNDIAKISPSVTFDTGYNPTDTRVNIRGLSATRGRANVAFLVDGVDVTSENVIAAGSGLLANTRLLNDVERIEIVKGSQSALYGRAAFAGAISYITKEPGDEFEGNVNVDAADNGFYQVGAAAGGPIFGDVFGMRLNGVVWEDDGYYTNSVSGKKVGGGDGFGTSLTAVLTPTDALKFKARVEYSDDHFDPQATVRIPQLAPLPYPESTVVRYNRRTAEGFLFGVIRGSNPPVSCVQDPSNPNTDCVVIETEAASTLARGYSGSTSGMPDHGLYCFDALPPELQDINTTVDERQLALKELYPDYPTMPAHVQKEDWEEGFADNDVVWKQALSDGSDPLVPGILSAGQFWRRPMGKLLPHSEDPATGEDYEGTDTDLLRASLLVTWDFDFGSFYVKHGIHRRKWYCPPGSGLPGSSVDRTHCCNPRALLRTTDTEQFSQEFRFSSNFDGPVQFTLGGLYCARGPGKYR